MAEQEFRSFLTKLAKEPHFRTEFAQDRTAVMDRAGLSQDEQLAIFSSDPKRIQQVLGESGEGDLLHVDAEIIIKLHIT